MKIIQEERKAPSFSNKEIEELCYYYSQLGEINELTSIFYTKDVYGLNIDLEELEERKRKLPKKAKNKLENFLKQQKIDNDNERWIKNFMKSYIVLDEIEKEMVDKMEDYQLEWIQNNQAAIVKILKDNIIDEKIGWFIYQSLVTTLERMESWKVVDKKYS